MEELSRAELHHILAMYRQFEPLYGDRLANHLPMAIVALRRLGADASAIHGFSRAYAKGSGRAPVPGTWTLPRRHVSAPERSKATQPFSQPNSQRLLPSHCSSGGFPD